VTKYKKLTNCLYLPLRYIVLIRYPPRYLDYILGVHNRHLERMAVYIAGKAAKNKKGKPYLIQTY